MRQAKRREREVEGGREQEKGGVAGVLRQALVAWAVLCWAIGYALL